MITWIISRGRFIWISDLRPTGPRGSGRDSGRQHAEPDLTRLKDEREGECRQPSIGGGPPPPRQSPMHFDEGGVTVRYLHRMEPRLDSCARARLWP